VAALGLAAGGLNLAQVGAQPEAPEPTAEQNIAGMLVAHLQTRRGFHAAKIAEIQDAAKHIEGHRAHIAEIDRHLASLGVKPPADDVPA
jgi:hypothetical protein